MGRMALVAVAVLGFAGAVHQAAPPVRPGAPRLQTRSGDALARLGRALYFDPQLSRPAGRACASCHDPEAGFSDPESSGPTSRGAVPGRVGGRNAPSAAYARFSPPFHFDAKAGTYVGGQFWDGRADSLEDQAAGPLLNPVEMNQPAPHAVIDVVRSRPYAALFRAVFGRAALDEPKQAFHDLTRAVAAYERTGDFAPFSSKYDAYLQGKARLSAAEARGLAIFEDPAKGNCAACHPSRPGTDGTPPLFTDFSYDNLGIPRNPRLGDQPVDLGLGGRIDVPSENGKFKVPTLRNVALTAPYTHNGYFQSLKELVHFYNTRDIEPWPAPEVPETVNHKELGNLHLTAQEEDDLVAFLGTLTDGYRAGSEKTAARSP